MSLTAEQYAALCKLSYATSIDTNMEGRTVAQILADAHIDSDTDNNGIVDPTFKVLQDTDVNAWQLVNVETTSHGFTGLALQNPDTHEMVFVFRGSELSAPFGIDWQDVWADANLFFGVNGINASLQFTDASNFVTETLDTIGTNFYEIAHNTSEEVSNISFTGHSLGGGIAEYMTWLTNASIHGGFESVTFNAVGIGSVVADNPNNLAFSEYNSTDHVNSYDTVGNYGVPLGDTIRHIDSSEVDYTRVDFSAIAKMLYIRLQAFEGMLQPIEASKEIQTILKSVEADPKYSRSDTLRVYQGYETTGGNGEGLTAYHSLDSFLVKNEDSSQYEMTAEAEQQEGLTSASLKDIYQLVNAIQVVEQSKSDDPTHFNQILPSNQIPLDAYQSSGIVYFRPDGSVSTHTYSDSAIAYAKYTIQRLQRALQTGTIAEPYAEYQQAIASNVRRIDPLILDLDGDGIETVNIHNSNAFFDLDLNGFAENTSWASGGDGFLVLDRNQDGSINNATELFGDRTLLSDGVTYASSGFQALADYDANQDGIIDASDNIYSLLRVWQDANGDGVSAISELKSLLDLGIVSIALNYLNTGITDISDNIQVRVGEFTRNDGSTSAIGEYLFNRDTANSIDEPIASLPPEIAALPNIQGAGNVPSLHKAMADDTSGVLQDLVEAFIAEDDIAVRNSLMEQIIIKWTGSDSIDPTSRGAFFDAQKLAAMEKFYGLSFSGNPTANAVTLLTSSYNKLFENIYVSFIAETHLKDILSLIDIDFLGNLSFTNVQFEIDTLFATDESSALTMLGELARVTRYHEQNGTDGFMALRNHYAVQSDEYARIIDFAGTQVVTGTSGDDSLSTGSNQNALDGGEGNDSLYANTISSVALYGGAGNDSLHASAGNDILNGGIGDDRLEGSAGNDTYMFGRGYGTDTIVDHDATVGNVDTIRFMNDVAAEDVIVRRLGNNLELSIMGTDDKLIVEQYFSRYYYAGYYSYDVGENGNKIEKIVFADGTTWTIADIKEMARTTRGTVGDDSISGFDDQDDIIEAYSGNDSIYTGAGNDAVNAGEGDDSVTTATGNDTVLAGAGNDTVDTGEGNDLLDGGIGNDRLIGGIGNDTYKFGRDYGTDTIVDRDGTEGNIDIVEFAADITPADLTVSRSGNDLLITINGTTDSLRVEQYFSRYYYAGYYSYDVGENGNKVEEFRFADGTVWTIADMKEKARTIMGTSADEGIGGYSDQSNIIYGLAGNDSLYGAGLADTLIGGEGNDTIDGQAGNDVIDGGTGDDVLIGSTGDDTYRFGRGYGIDTIVDRDTTVGNQDTIQFDTDITPSDVTVVRSGNNLELRINGTEDKLVVEQYFSRYYYSGYYSYDVGEDGNKVELVQFADGTTWTIADVKEKARTITGTALADGISGYSDQANIIYGLDGDDSLYGAGLADTLKGGAGNDTLDGQDGADLLDGDTGNDLLIGSTGNDTYVFGRGYGNDTIRDRDSTTDNLDKITMLEDVSPNDVTVVRSGDNLILKINGTDDTLTVEQYFSRYYYSGYYSYDVGEDGNKVEQIVFSDGTIWSIADIKEKARDITGTTGDDYLSGYNDQNDRVVALAGNDTISTSGGDDVIDAGVGDDTVYAGTGNDSLQGGAGNDTLYGNEGNDLLDGGTGVDRLEGGLGNDIYVFGTGYGIETISDPDSTIGNQDIVQFTTDIDPSDILVRRSGDNLELQISGTDDKLVIERYFSRWFYSGYYGYDMGENGNAVELLAFADGTVWTIADVKEKARTLVGTSGSDSISGFADQANVISGLEGDDYLYGNVQADQLLGGSGNDTLYGYGGNDTMDGGTGNDQLEGADGNDTYVFGRGYGVDTIADADSLAGNTDTLNFLEDISPSDVSVARSGNNLELRINGTSDKVIVENFFSAYSRNGYYTGENSNAIEQVHFADGTSWDIAALKEKARTITGTPGSDYIGGYGDQKNIILGLDGDDTLYAAGQGDQLAGGSGNDALYGSSGADLLDGGVGDDRLEGSAGNDTYVFGRGSGVDTIYDSDSSSGNLDAVTFQNDIAPENVQVKRSGDNLELAISGTQDKLIIERYFSAYTKYGYYAGADSNVVEEIRFADGTIWDASTAKEKARNLIGTDGNDVISGFSDQQSVIAAGDGNDTVYAGPQGDQIDTGAGDDVVYGSTGNDHIIGGSDNDTLEGNGGNDTYVFAPGFGVDTVYDTDNGAGNSLDVVEFATGINPEDVTMRRLSNDDLEITLITTGDKLTIQRYFSNYYRNSSWYTGVNSNAIEQFHFADGTTWDIAAVKEKVRHITGTAGNDNLQGFYDQQNIIVAGEGDDTLYATSSLNDKLYGEAGIDTLYGTSGNELLDGGMGNDRLEGNSGNDTYVFGPGYGQDVIYDTDNGAGNSVDVVNFLEGINPADVSVKRLSNDDLELTFAGSTDKLTVERFFSSYYRNSSWYTGTNSNAIEQFHFADGTVWDIATIKDKARFINGTTGNDNLQGFYDQQNVISGGDGDDALYAISNLGDKLAGDAGNDNIFGTSGNEILDGGTDNDRLEGNSGNDTYSFAAGYGQDVIYDTDNGAGNSLDKVIFQEGISPENVTAKRLTNDDLELSFAGSGDKLTIERYFSSYYRNSSWYTGVNSNAIEEFHFADGTVWNIDTIRSLVQNVTGTDSSETLYGYEGNDTIHAGAGDDTISSASGNDSLYGEAGNDNLYAGEGNDILYGDADNDYLSGDGGDDTYVFSGDFGSDRIYDYSGNDLVQFTDTAKDNLIFEQVGNKLQISSAGSSNSVSIDYYYQYNDYKVENFKASDGSTITNTQVEQLIQAMASWSANNNGMSWSQALSSNPQDVQAIVSQYWTAPTV